MRVSFRKTFFGACAFSFLIGCSTNPVTQRSQLMLVSENSLISASYQAYASLKADASSKGVFNKDAGQVQRVREIAYRLIPHAIHYRSEALSWNWEINVIESDSPNAFCMAGGKMAVNSGMLTKIKVTDDELAQVVAHEIAHALSDHTREKISLSLATNAAVNAIAVWQGLGSVSTDVLGGLANLAIGLPNSRGAEAEADEIGIMLAAKAGYNPEAAVSLWEKMRLVSGETPTAILSTHPLPSERISFLKVQSSQLMPTYHETLKLRSKDMLPKLDYSNGKPKNLYQRGRYELPAQSQ